MGTTVRDFFHSEFVLIGIPPNFDPIIKEMVENKLISFYKTITTSIIYITEIVNAELIKILYNTYIGMKIVFANTAMELCHRIPRADVDKVQRGLSFATERLHSPAYTKGGMGDGGACHPRDNIAMSWLSRRLGLKYDFFESIMLFREKQTEWLVDLIMKPDLPVTILGYAFKKNTNMVDGSPALLLMSILEERGVNVRSLDPLIHPEHSINFFEEESNQVFFLGCCHDIFREAVFPRGSIIIDPFRFLDINDDYAAYFPIGAE